MTNCEPLRWLVETMSRGVYHYRIMNVSAVDIAMSHGHVTLQVNLTD